MFTKIKFVHTQDMETLKRLQAFEIVSVLRRMFNPHKVADVGCGTASLLAEFKRNGVVVHGYDGKWVNKNFLFQNISTNEFTEIDLEHRLEIHERYDLVLCLEVAEHLSEARAASLVNDLCKASDTVIFSAAVPGQGGQNHINEQWIDYWISKFEDNGFQFHDVLKSQWWENNNILWWYRQNMVVFSKKSIEFSAEVERSRNYLSHVIHPVLFTTITDFREKNAIKRHIRGLYKAILFRLKIIR